MMSYQIYITRKAENDLIQAADYIEFILKNPQAASALLDRADKKIRELADFPEKSALVEDPVLRAWGIRFTQVNHYLAFYIISEEEQRIYIVRFLYEKRNWISILKSGYSLE